MLTNENGRKTKRLSREILGLLLITAVIALFFWGFLYLTANSISETYFAERNLQPSEGQWLTLRAWIRSVSLLSTVILFLVLFLFLKKFLFGRINAILEERARVVQSEIDKAKEEAEMAEKIRSDYEASMSSAKEDAKKIIADAQKTANAQSAAITHQAQEEANRIVESTRKELEIERERSVASAQNEIVSLAMEAAQKVLEREMDEKDNRAIVDAFLAEEE